MNPRNKTKDFFLDLGVTVSLYTVVISLLNLLFTVINNAYPQVINGYSYFGSQSISWPVAVLVIFFPIFIFLMWFVGKDMSEERKNSGIHKFLTYLTLFIAGIVVAGDLITVIYYFIDGQELTTGFLLKVLAILVVIGSVFMYYITDLRGKLTSGSRNFWRAFAFVVVIGSIVWGFSVLGSPQTQRLLKYDEQKLGNLGTINGMINDYYGVKNKLPESIDVISKDLGGYGSGGGPIDEQTGKPYEYIITGAKTFELCAVFNKPETNKYVTSPYGDFYNQNHPAGRYCYNLTVQSEAPYPPKPMY